MKEFLQKKNGFVRKKEKTEDEYYNLRKKKKNIRIVILYVALQVNFYKSLEFGN